MPVRYLQCWGPMVLERAASFSPSRVSLRERAKFVVNDTALSGCSPRVRCFNGVALVPEARRNMFPTLSVRENLLIGLAMTARSERAAVQDSLFELFPILRDRLATRAGMLSGGEQQMLAIAIALGRKPRLLILDEPTQGLAPSIFDILEQVLSHARRLSLGILLAEQNLAFASRVADRFVILSHGKIASSGDRQDLLDEEAVAAAYLGISPTETILSDTPQRKT
jgi:branched-chain amino acid transport system ATP-binding protein